MTLAEKLIKDVPFTTIFKGIKDNEIEEDFIVEFQPVAFNTLKIIRKDYDNDVIYLPYESAVKLAKFLKVLFLDKELSK